MRILNLHIGLLLLLFLCNCSKGNDESTSESFFKVVETNGDYFARNLLEFNDGSILIGAVASIGNEFDEGNNPTSEQPSILVKYDANGDVIWRRETPEVVHTLWSTVKLKNGNIALAGFNSDDNSKQVGIVILNQDAEIISQSSYFNVTEKSPLFLENPVTCLELSNGNLALVTTTSNSFPYQVAMRLVVMDADLNLVLDKIHIPDSIIPYRAPSQITLAEDQMGNLMMNGRDFRFLPSDSLYNFGISIKLQAGSFQPLFFKSISSEINQSPSRFALSQSGDMVWTSTYFENSNFDFGSWFNFRNQEKFKIGPKTRVWITDGVQGNSQEKLVFDSYPKNGFFNKTISTSDGGYMLIGTCNINSNQDFASDYKTMMVKLNSSLQMEWIRYPNNNSNTIAQDIIETATGYIISATHLSLGEENRPLIFKTDKNGRIK